MNPEQEIERIRLRCVCGEDGCWRWSGSTNRNGIPTLTRYFDGVKKCVSGRRWMLQMIGKTLSPSTFVITTCDVPECLNPEHLRVVTRSTIQRVTNKRNPGLASQRGIAIKAAWNRKGKGHKLTQETADYARDPSRDRHEVAAELGVSGELVRQIRAGKIWRQANNPFAGLMA